MTQSAGEIAALTPERFVNMIADMREISAAEFAARYPEFMRASKQSIADGRP